MHHVGSGFVPWTTAEFSHGWNTDETRIRTSVRKIRNTNHSKLRAARRNLRRRGVTLLAFRQCNSIRFGACTPVSAGIESSLVRSLGPHGWRGNPTDKKLDSSVGPAWQPIRGIASPSVGIAVFGSGRRPGRVYSVFHPWLLEFFRYGS